MDDRARRVLAVGSVMRSTESRPCVRSSLYKMPHERWREDVMHSKSEGFQVGEAVTIIQPYLGLGVGRVGIITRSYRTDISCYRVHFAHLNLTVPVPKAYLTHYRYQWHNVGAYPHSTPPLEPSRNGVISSFLDTALPNPLCIRCDA